MNMKNGVLVAAALTLPLHALADDPLRVGFVYVGPVGDLGWSYQHDQGRIAMEEHFDGAVETTYVENVGEGADAERTIRSLAQSGHDIIFTTSFGFMNPTLRVAADYPEKTFLHATGYQRADNVGNYLSTTYEGRYITGMAAAMVSENNHLGYIASYPIPEVIRDINAVYLGARAVDPDVQLDVIWVNTWFDPAAESDAANTLMDQGADVIDQHTDSPSPLIAAGRRDHWGTGKAADMSQFAPEAHLLSVVNNWTPYYIRTVQAVMDGTWESEDYWGGMGDDIIQIASLTNELSADQVAELESVMAGIGSGEFHPFTGPLNDQSGTLRLEEGAVMSNGDLAGMNWYVEGMTATYPD